jgi:hypothetical protein
LGITTNLSTNETGVRSPHEGDQRPK